MSDLRDVLVNYPGVRKVTATREDVRETLLASDGTMLLNGYQWNIKSEHIGAGIYKVWLEYKL